MTFNITACGPPQFKKWELIKFSSTRNPCYVIRTKSTKEGNISIQLFPYEKQDSKFVQVIWFNLLRLLVLIRII